jgi:hypothetical protein
MCRVLNRHHAGVPASAVYIGRGLKWGNPFRIGPDGDRATVIAKHERWLADQHQLLHALDELRGRDLVCFCEPRPCHSDLVLRLANATRDAKRRCCVVPRLAYRTYGAPTKAFPYMVGPRVRIRLPPAGSLSQR